MNSVGTNIAAYARRFAWFPRDVSVRGRQALKAIAAWEPDLQRLSDAELRKRSLALRFRARTREPLDQLLPEAYALVREAARRTIGMRHYEVQLLCGMALHHGAIAEMQTGEGKTLAATLPLYLAALRGKGAHLATVNDYLARRDREWMGPIYELLGLTAGVVTADMTADEKRHAYHCDVTYGTAKELGFDFLRDRLLLRRLGGSPDRAESSLFHASKAHLQPVQRGAYFIVVDEADCILIDDARTPLIISAAPSLTQRARSEAYRWSADGAPQFVEDVHYHYDHAEKEVELTPAGRRRIRSLPKPAALDALGMLEIYDFLERAILVSRDYLADRDFVVRDGEIVIVDENTGRLAEGRKWRGGIHQAVEAKEGLEVTLETGRAASITVQDYFRRYTRLAGMTGTALSSAHEFKKVYGSEVVAIPTHRPLIRRQWPTSIHGTGEAKWNAVVQEIARVHAQGRPVLIGTRSIERSEHLSELLERVGILHQVLNARQHAAEADIIARAGERGRVTVATNMAGRGVDIKLGEGVAELGGLHVICTEMHEAARIDRQLIGRCARQGDPGSYRCFLALDDELLASGFGPRRAKRLAQRGRHAPQLSNAWEQTFRKAQRIVERRHARARRALMYHQEEREKLQKEMGQDPYLDALG